MTVLPETLPPEVRGRIIRIQVLTLVWMTAKLLFRWVRLGRQLAVTQPLLAGSYIGTSLREIENLAFAERNFSA
jgi:hypothetical protein